MVVGIIKICLIVGVVISALSYSNWLYETARARQDQRVLAGRTVGGVLFALLVMVIEGVAWGVAILLTPFAVLGDFMAFGRAPGGRRPVLLVHGYLHNRTAWVPHGLRLRRAGWTQVYTINLWPLSADLDAYAQQVSNAVERIYTETGADRIDIIGHSMGGVVSRAYAQKFGGRERLAHLITLGSPHHGALSAPFGPWPNALQMAVGSDYLAELNADPHTLLGVAVTSIYSVHDNIVLPTDSSALPEPAETHVAENIGHATLLWSPTVWRLIESALRTEPTEEAA